jgi:hypothetical protein
MLPAAGIFNKLRVKVCFSAGKMIFGQEDRVEKAVAG